MRNFFFFFDGDFDGEPSGDKGPLVTDSVLSLVDSVSVPKLAGVWLEPMVSSHVVWLSSLPFSSTVVNALSVAVLESAGTLVSSVF